MWTSVANMLFHGWKKEAPQYGFFVDFSGKGKLFSIFLLSLSFGRASWWVHSLKFWISGALIASYTITSRQRVRLLSYRIKPTNQQKKPIGSSELFFFTIIFKTQKKNPFQQNPFKTHFLLPPNLFKILLYCQNYP